MRSIAVYSGVGLFAYEEESSTVAISPKHNAS